MSDLAIETQSLHRHFPGIHTVSVIIRAGIVLLFPIGAQFVLQKIDV